MQQIAERLAGISLTSVVLILIILTLMRGAMNRSRAPLVRGFGEILESVILSIAIVFLLLRPFVVQSYFIPSDSMRPTLWEGDYILVNKWVYRMHPPSSGDVIVFHAPPEASENGKEFINRIIGVPGDTIEIQEGYVAIGSDRYTRQEIRQSLGESLSVDSWPTSQDNLPPLRLTTDAIWLGGRKFSPEQFAAAVHRDSERAEIHPGRFLKNGVMLMESYVREDAQYRMPPQTVPPGHFFVLGDNRNSAHDSHIWGMLPSNTIIGRAECVFWPISHVKRIRNK